MLTLANQFSPLGTICSKIPVLRVVTDSIHTALRHVRTNCAMAVPISSRPSSWTKWIRLTAISVRLGPAPDELADAPTHDGTRFGIDEINLGMFVRIE